MNNRYILGIDTSNYKTSIAAVNEHKSIICDLRKFLKVKQGEKGLRQSDALFQHVKNFPEMMEELSSRLKNPENSVGLDSKPSAIAYSARPRPVDGSYMPVFMAGESFARSLGAMLDIPVYAFSHQEGHIEAIKAYSKFADENRFLACHFSGGTTELLEVNTGEAGYDINIIGGSDDIAFGQVIDRAGVMMGMEFPAGEALDNIASAASASSRLLTTIKVKNARMNLSGIDTQMKRIIESKTAENIPDELVRELFEKLADAMAKMLIQGAEKSDINKILMAGGVSSSHFIRKRLTDKLSGSGVYIEFDDKGLAQDNAVGTALLGGKALWR